MKAGLVLALIVISALPFLPGLRSPFFYDDHNTIVMNSAIKTPHYAEYFYKLETFSADQARMFRPIVLASLALNWQMFGADTFGWHLTNLCAHLLCVAVVFLLIETLSGSALLAFMTALFFGVHPSRVEPVLYISARSEIFASLFYLLSFWLFLKAGQAAKKSAWTALGILSALGFWLGLLSKDIAITLPAVLTLERLLFKKLDKRSVYLLSVFWFSALAYFLVRRGLSLYTFFPPERPRPVLENLLLQSRVMVYYLRFLVFPVHPAVDLQFSPVSSWAWLTSLMILAAVAMAGMLLWRKKPLLTFFALFFFIALSPSSSLAPLVVEGNVNRVYMAGLAVFVVFSELLALVFGKDRRAGSVLAALVFICLFALSLEWAGKWPSPISLWRRTVSNFPNHSRAHNNLGLMLERGGNYEQAEREYQSALLSGPENASALDNYARVLFARGEFKRAEFYFNKALFKDPGSCIVRINFGQMLIQLNRLEEAKQLLEEINFCPDYPDELARQRERVNKLLNP